MALRHLIEESLQMHHELVLFAAAQIAASLSCPGRLYRLNSQITDFLQRIIHRLTMPKSLHYRVHEAIELGGLVGQLEVDVEKRRLPLGLSWICRGASDVRCSAMVVGWCQVAARVYLGGVASRLLRLPPVPIDGGLCRCLWLR